MLDIVAADARCEKIACAYMFRIPVNVVETSENMIITD